MTSRVRIFLLWLLAFAIPVQGFAAAVQMGCAPVQQNQQHPVRAIHAPATSPDDHRHAGHDMSAMHQMHDGADQQHTGQHQHSTPMTAQADAGPSDHSPLPHQHKTSSASCSSCSVCTIGAILPLALDKLINLPVAADIHIAMTQHGYVGYTPENPERPPSLPV